MQTGIHSRTERVKHLGGYLRILCTVYIIPVPCELCCLLVHVIKASAAKFIIYKCYSNCEKSEHIKQIIERVSVQISVTCYLLETCNSLVLH